MLGAVDDRDVLIGSGAQHLLGVVQRCAWEPRRVGDLSPGENALLQRLRGKSQIEPDRLSMPSAAVFQRSW